MPSLRFLLEHQDVVFRQLVAQAWGLDEAEILARNPEALTQALLNAPLEPVWQALDEESRGALAELARHGTTLPWMPFVQRYGPLRPMGPARMLREAPHQHPVSPLEALWYRGLVGRHLEVTTTSGATAQAFLPQEWHQRLQPLLREVFPHPPGRPALPEEIEAPQGVSPALVEDLVTTLAGKRQNASWEQLQQHLDHSYPPAWWNALGQALGLWNREGSLDLEQTAAFLHRSREEALTLVWHAWLEMPQIELELLPGWEPVAPLSGAKPHQARRWLMEQVAALPHETWWSLPAFVNGLARRVFDLPIGPADQVAHWRFRAPGQASPVGWFSHVLLVVATWLHFTLTGPMHWLGWVEVAGRAFRPSPWLDDALRNRVPRLPQSTQGRLWVRQDGVVMVPVQVPWVVRYQVARAAVWLPREQKEVYPYRWMPQSLAQARATGWTVRGLLATLHRHGQALPRWMRQALVRWEQGHWARVERAWILEVPEPQALEALLRSPAGSAVVRVLSPTVALVRAGTQKRVHQELLRLGYLVGSQHGNEAREDEPLEG